MKAKIRFDCSCACEYLRFIDEEYDDCGHAGCIDCSDLKLELVNDSFTVVNDTTTVIAEIHVSELQDQIEPWSRGLQFVVLPTLKIILNNCPYPAAGHTVRFKTWPHVNFNLEIPEYFKRRWKLKIQIFVCDVLGKQVDEECIQVKFEIMEY